MPLCACFTDKTLCEQLNPEEKLALSQKLHGFYQDLAAGKMAPALALGEGDVPVAVYPFHPNLDGVRPMDTMWEALDALYESQDTQGRMQRHDANIGAVMCCVGILLSVGFFRINKSVVIRVLLVLNIALEIFYIAFSDSRTGQLCLCVGAALYVLLVVLQKKKRLVAVFCALIGLIIAFIIPVGIKKTYNVIAAMPKKVIVQDASAEDQSEGLVKEEQKEESKESEELQKEDTSENPKEPVQEVGRAEEYSGDITNRRSDIWKSAIEVFLTSPVVGVSHNNVLAYVYDNVPNSYLVTNDHMDFDSMHNVFFDILVGQGVIGLAIYLAMAVLSFITIVKNWSKILKNTSKMCVSYFVILMVMVTASFVMTEIVYVTSPMATIFWMCMSCLIQAASQSENKGVN